MIEPDHLNVARVALDRDEHVEMRLLISGVFVSELVSRPMVDVLNTNYSSIIIQNQVVLGILKNDGYLLVFLIIIAGGRNILGHSVIQFGIKSLAYVHSLQITQQ